MCICLRMDFFFYDIFLTINQKTVSSIKGIDDNGNRNIFSDVLSIVKNRRH